MAETGRRKYRIATNGRDFRIERQALTFWRKRPYWEPVWFGRNIGIFPGIAEATNAMDELERTALARYGEWRPVNGE